MSRRFKFTNIYNCKNVSRTLGGCVDKNCDRLYIAQFGSTYVILKCATIRRFISSARKTANVSKNRMYSWLWVALCPTLKRRSCIPGSKNAQNVMRNISESRQTFVCIVTSPYHQMRLRKFIGMIRPRILQFQQLCLSGFGIVLHSHRSLRQRRGHRFQWKYNARWLEETLHGRIRMLDAAKAE